MEMKFSKYHEDLTILCRYLDDGIAKNWSHELRKQILMLLHSLKNNSRKLDNLDMESELIALEETLGYGSGVNAEPEIVQVKEHQSRLLNLIAFPDEIPEDVDIISENSMDKVASNKASVQLILCNCPGRDDARALANGLVKARLAACVNIIANIGSIYWWDGEIKDTAECQLQIKTSSTNLDNVIHYIKQHHPHEVPEIMAVTVDNGNQDYFDWIEQETDGSK